MKEFLSTPYGIAAFLLFDFFALLFVITVTYRWLFKHIFDFLAAVVCIILTSPFWGVVTIRRGIEKKKGERERVFDLTEIVGKRGKEVRVLSFENSFVKYLPRLFDIFLGKLSFVGPSFKVMEEAETFTDVQKDVFLVRPGLISPITSVKAGEEALDKELKYAWQFGFFTDFKIFFTWLIKKIRGEA